MRSATPQQLSPELLVTQWMQIASSGLHLHRAVLNTLAAWNRYAGDFVLPYLIAVSYFYQVEHSRWFKLPLVDTARSYTDLLGFTLELASRAMAGSIAAVETHSARELDRFLEAWLQWMKQGDASQMEAVCMRQAHLTGMLAFGYPEAIERIAPEFGFHFDSGIYPRIAETDRFNLYQILPTDSKIQARDNAKPILIIPPYVLGANILGFLPGENRSYAHCYANQGIPTYIRTLKDIRTSEALQVMTGEDDARDTREFCQRIRERHGRPVTLNGYCQGGFSALCNLLSGELDGLVDAFITCVAPMDGTRSHGLSTFLNNLPQRFNDLAYGTKTLANGNTVADGRLMGWVYKLKSIETEYPLAAFYRDLMMFAMQEDTANLQVGKTAAALNYWLTYERSDLPMDITRMSFASYNTPISADGDLPLKLFNRKLNLKRLREMGIPWLICYGEHDDLVEKETALAPLDWVEAEVTGFPKGHVAIATSWSDPSSACALHTRFGEDGQRGPVRFQLDLSEK